MDKKQDEGYAKGERCHIAAQTSGLQVSQWTTVALPAEGPRRERLLWFSLVRPWQLDAGPPPLAEQPDPRVESNIQEQLQAHLDDSSQRVTVRALPSIQLRRLFLKTDKTSEFGKLLEDLEGWQRSSFQYAADRSLVTAKLEVERLQGAARLAVQWSRVPDPVLETEFEKALDKVVPVLPSEANGQWWSRRLSSTWKPRTTVSSTVVGTPADWSRARPATTWPVAGQTVFLALTEKEGWSVVSLSRRQVLRAAGAPLYLGSLRLTKPMADHQWIDLGRSGAPQTALEGPFSLTRPGALPDAVLAGGRLVGENTQQLSDECRQVLSGLERELPDRSLQRALRWTAEVFQREEDKVAGGVHCDSIFLLRPSVTRQFLPDSKVEKWTTEVSAPIDQRLTAIAQDSKRWQKSDRYVRTVPHSDWPLYVRSRDLLKPGAALWVRSTTSSQWLKQCQKKLTERYLAVEQRPGQTPTEEETKVATEWAKKIVTDSTTLSLLRAPEKSPDIFVVVKLTEDLGTDRWSLLPDGALDQETEEGGGGDWAESFRWSVLRVQRQLRAQWGHSCTFLFVRPGQQLLLAYE